MFALNLSFKSIEDLILAASAVRQALPNYDLSDRVTTTPARAPKAATEPAAAAPGKSATTAKPAGGTPAAPAGPSTAAEKKENESSASATPAASGDYAPVSAAITAAVNGGHKPAVIALLTKFGAKSGKELKAEQYADFMTELATITDDVS